MRMEARGFTLLELLAVVSVAVLLAAIAAPSLERFRARQQIDAELSLVARQWSAARTLARNHRRSVVWCAVDAEGQCSFTEASEYMLFNDADGDREPDPDETVLDRSPRRFTGAIEGKFSNRAYLRFKRRTGAMESGHFRLCLNNGGKQLVVYRTGRIRREAVKASVCADADQ